MPLRPRLLRDARPAAWMDHGLPRAGCAVIAMHGSRCGAATCRLAVALILQLALLAGGCAPTTSRPASSAPSMEQQLSQQEIEQRARLIGFPDLGHFNAHMKAQESAVAADPGNRPARILLAADYIIAGRWNDARMRAAEAVKLDPTDVTAQGLLGRTCLESGDLNGAAEAYAAADPAEPRVQEGLAIALFGTQRYAEAIEPLRKVVQQSPQDAYYRFDLAWALMQTGDHDAGVREWNAAEALDPEQARRLRAIAHLSDGWPNAAASQTAANDRTTEEKPWYKTAGAIAAAPVVVPLAVVGAILEPLRGSLAGGVPNNAPFVVRDADGCPVSDYQCRNQASQMRQMQSQMNEMQERQQYYDAMRQQRSLDQMFGDRNNPFKFNTYRAIGN